MQMLLILQKNIRQNFSKKMISKIILQEDFTVSKAITEKNPNKFKTKTQSQKRRDKVLKWKDWTLYEKGFEIDLKSGLNIVVGNNGIGKTCFFENLINRTYEFVVVGDFVQIAYFNTKNQDLGTVSENVASLTYPSGIGYAKSLINLANSTTNSHGENYQQFWDSFFNFYNTKTNWVIIIDEPEAGLDINTKKFRVKQLKKLAKKHQIVIITHDYWFMKACKTLYNFNTKQFENTVDFLA